MEIRLAADLQPDSIVDGEGIRTVVWTQGCPHNCKGCHNPGTHDFNGGFLMDVDEVIEELKNIEGQDGITLSGGDPLCQSDACIEICKAAKELGLNIWCYTGYVWEKDVCGWMSEQCPETKEILSLIDVCVDGPFIEARKNISLQFRGSENQRLIDVSKTLQTGEVVLWTE